MSPADRFLIQVVMDHKSDNLRAAKRFVPATFVLTLRDWW